MNDTDRIIQAAALLAQYKKVKTRWQWDESMPHYTGPKPIAPVTDRSWKLLGIPVLDYWPGKDKPEGWSILWHKWNKGLTLSYIRPCVGTHQEFVTHEDATTIYCEVNNVSDKPSFWQKHLPAGFSFTIAKLNGKWRMNRHPNPFLMASLDAAPLLSVEEWKKLGDGGEIVYNSNDDVPKGEMAAAKSDQSWLERDQSYQSWRLEMQARKANRSHE